MPIGPQMPPHLATTTAVAGPQLPPHLAAAAATTTSTATEDDESNNHDPEHDEADKGDDSDSDSDFGPSLPPDMVASRTTSEPIKRVLGPTMPPGYIPPTTTTSTRRKETPLSNAYLDESDSDDDGGFGPMPLPAGVRVEDNSGARAFREREEREEERRREALKGDGKPKREEWMLLPPEDVDLLSTMDPTKLKSRTFAQNPKGGLASTSSSSKKPTGPNLWTETPAERQQRLEDELMGRKRKSEISAGGGGDEDEEETDERRRKRERDRQLREEVDRHNKAIRSETLLDKHGKDPKTKKGKDDGPPGIWDRDRDMSVGGRLMDDSKRADTLRNAKELGGRFGRGSFL